MSLFAKLEAAAQAKQAAKQAAKQDNSFESTSEIVNVQLLTGPIAGPNGRFRKFTVKGIDFNINDADVVNAEMFVPNCECTITTTRYVNKEGVEKFFASGLSVNVRDGMFVARRN